MFSIETPVEGRVEAIAPALKEITVPLGGST